MLDFLKLFQLIRKTIEMVCMVQECEAVIARPVLVSRTAALVLAGRLSRALSLAAATDNARTRKEEPWV